MVSFYILACTPPQRLEHPTLEFNQTCTCLTIRGRNVVLMPVIDDMQKSRTR